MNNETTHRYEKILRELLDDLRSAMNQPVDESRPVQVDGTMGRVSRGDAMQVQQLALEMKRRREGRIQAVEAALERIRLGTYGFCVRCENPIDQGRLEVLPDVVLCVRCASNPKR
ncbi:MAG TPA: hypothetical protein ENN34_05730 [Deltaproteobacteria bacterium]|nr:hypothetical protein [Deltaproteobacteria bacterium]HDP24927.1 hypothetical protein [Deltaproteobacteria bacterium]